MKKGLLAIALFIGVSVSYGQQDPQYSQFMFDKLSVNPGFAGLSGNYCGTLMYRNQWMGYEGSPNSILFNAEGPVKILHGGVGLTVYNDQLGFENNTIARASYSYHTGRLGPGMLGGGISLGYAGKTIGGDWNSIDPNDPYIPENQTQGSFDLGLGLYYQMPKQFYVGISTTHLLGQPLDKINIDVARHYWIMAGYTYKNLMGGSLWLEPSVLAKSDAASTQLDFNVTGKYWMGTNALWAGVSYRLQDAISPMVGYMIGKPGNKKKGSQYYSIGLAYDVTTSPLKNYTSGTLELFIKVCFKPVSIPERVVVKDVRFL